MKRAVVVYRSRTGTTRRMAEEIGAYLRERGLDVEVRSVGEVDLASLPGADYLLLGCWTSGLFVVRQRPDGPFVALARDLPPMPALAGTRVALFTTYKLVTGSMFGKMRASLAGKTGPIELELKSRDGSLSAAHRDALAAWLAAGS